MCSEKPTPCFGLTPAFGTEVCPYTRGCGDLHPPPWPVCRSTSSPTLSLAARVEKVKFDALERPPHGPVTWSEWRAVDHERQMRQFGEIWRRRHGENADALWAAQKREMEKRLADVATRMSWSPSSSPAVRSPVRQKRRMWSNQESRDARGALAQVTPG